MKKHTMQHSITKSNTQLSRVWDKLLLSGVKNQKSVLIKTSDQRSKRRH